MSEELSPKDRQRILDFMSGAISVIRAHDLGSEGVIFAGMLKSEKDIPFEELEAHYEKITEWMNKQIPINKDPEEQHVQMHKYMRIGTEEINKHMRKKEKARMSVAGAHEAA